MPEKIMVIFVKHIQHLLKMLKPWPLAKASKLHSIIKICLQKIFYKINTNMLIQYKMNTVIGSAEMYFTWSRLPYDGRLISHDQHTCFIFVDPPGFGHFCLWYKLIIGFIATMWSINLNPFAKCWIHADECHINVFWSKGVITNPGLPF